MSKERISRNPEKSREIPGIVWPTSPLPTELLTAIFNRSYTHSLREITARILEEEASVMWRQYQEQFAPPPNGRFDQDIAIRDGYAGVPKDLLQACNYFNDRQGAVGLEMSRLKVAENMLGVEPNEVIEKNLRRVTEGIMNEAIKSLTIDPSGIKWLTRQLHQYEVVLNNKDNGTTKYGDDDPQVFGYKKGIARYKSLYSQAKKAGATPDKR